jgi:hypothetical protein
MNIFSVSIGNWQVISSGTGLLDVYDACEGLRPVWLLSQASLPDQAAIQVIDFEIPGSVA